MSVPQRGQAGYVPVPVSPDTAAKWAVIDALSAHRYDYDDKGSKPNDPGWHACSCGEWEGYWCAFESEHLSLEILRSLKAAGEAHAVHVLQRLIPVNSEDRTLEAMSIDLEVAAIGEVLERHKVSPTPDMVSELWQLSEDKYTRHTCVHLEWESTRNDNLIAKSPRGLWVLSGETGRWTVFFQATFTRGWIAQDVFDTEAEAKDYAQKVEDDRRV